MEVDANTLILEHSDAEDRSADRGHTEVLPHEGAVAQCEVHAPLAGNLNGSAVGRDGHPLRHRLDGFVRRELGRTD
eukprot:6508991-Heterocapsa_arctica.AAC.1